MKTRALSFRVVVFVAINVGLGLAVPGLAPPCAAIAIDRTGDLGFGSIVAGNAGGSVTVAPNGDRNAGGDVALGSAVGAGAARFTVSGDPLSAFSVILPASTNLVDGGASMVVDTFTSSPSGSGALGAGGTAEIKVGATLRVGAGQESGAYSGTFDVTVVLE